MKADSPEYDCFDSLAIHAEFGLIFKVLTKLSIKVKRSKISVVLLGEYK